MLFGYPCYSNLGNKRSESVRRPRRFEIQRLLASILAYQEALEDRPGVSLLSMLLTLRKNEVIAGL